MGVNRENASISFNLAPMLRQALADTQPDEDFEEALLRALKVNYPEQASALLSACSRLIEIEAKRAGETKERTIRRLAETDSGLKMNFRNAGLGPIQTSVQTTVVRVGDNEYHSLDEVPPDIRRAIEEQLASGKIESRNARKLRVGCSLAPLAWLLRLRL